MLHKIITIVQYYKLLIREIIIDIKTYYTLMCIGTIIIILISTIVFKMLGGFDLSNFKLAFASLVGLVGNFVLNLYLSTVVKIRESDKKKRKHILKIKNFF